MAKKLTFDEALEAIGEQRGITSHDVQARALRRMVWVAEWHIPGCLSESFDVVTTKRDAIECALRMAEGPEGPPRGMLSDLRRFGRSDRVTEGAWARSAITTIERRALWTLF